MSFDSPEPCTTFSYGVSAFVNDDEGPKTEFLGDRVPPKDGDKSHPKLIIEEKYNTTVKFILEAPLFNQKCEVEQYHVKYVNLGVMDEQETTIPISDLQDGKIVLEDFPGAADNGMRIEARIKYLGFDSWSPWISTETPIPEILVEDVQNVLVPVVIGAVVAVVVLVVIIYFIVKKKNSDSKFETENGDASESKKLKDNPEV